jgi:hypothetical protein
MAVVRSWARRLAPASPAAELGQLGALIAATLQETDVDSTSVTVSARDDGSLRVVFTAGSRQDEEAAAAALADLLGPVGRSRYYLVESVQPAPAGPRLLWRGAAIERAFSVPRALARKSRAEALLAAWQRHRNPEARLLHASTPEAQALLRRHLHRRPIGGEVSLHHVWR